jgi:hypothetical protein
MNVGKFLHEAQALAQSKGWRYGQACFNLLLDKSPEMAEAIRGTDKDPFYAGRDSERFRKFVEYLNASATE